MSTAYIYNASFPHDDKEGVPGIYLKFASVNFWFPFGKVTPVPDYNFREVDHDKSTAERGDRGEVTYQNVFLDGTRLAEFLTKGQIPYENYEKGIQIIEGKSTGEGIVVFAGVEAHSGMPIMREVIEKQATRSEIERAEKAAETYEKQVIAEYFDSKRQRMTGGQGKHTADKVTRKYMERWNVEDIDDVTAHQKNVGGMSPEAIAALVQAIYAGQEQNGAKLLEAIETVRKATGPSLQNAKNGRRSLGLAENAAKYDAEQAAKEAEKVET